MKSGNFKKPSAELAPGPKRLEKIESGPTLDLHIGRMKQTERQQFPEETSAQKVLRLPELVSIIFGHLAADWDLETLKNARAVSSLWKHEVFITLRKNLFLMPCILVGNPNSNDFGVSVECPQKSLQSSVDSLMPGCGFPLKLSVNEWSTQLESFIRDFSREIVRFEINGMTFGGFPVDLATIELPALKHASFSAFGIRSDERYLGEFVKVVKFWNQLVRTSKNLKTCEVHIEISDSEKDLSHDNAAFDQVEWTRVNSLKCNYEFFVEVSATYELSALDDLNMYSSPSLKDDLVEQMSLAKVPNLRNVEFGNKVEWILNHQMKKLEELMLHDGATINGTQQTSKLLPNLKNILIRDLTKRGRSFASLISGGGVFENAVGLNLDVDCVSLDKRIDEVAVQLCDSFPNLTDLGWHCGDWAFALKNKHALLAAPVIFSRLEFLTTLDLFAFKPTGRKMVELVTGITLQNIPEDENSWPTALVGNARSIVNLKNLTWFHLGAENVRIVRIVTRHTRFLFAAAFRTMETLKALCFTNIIFEDTSCTTEWREMGRKITLDNYY